MNGDGGVENESNERLAFYEREVSIRISIETVVFVDGRLVGPDRKNWLPRWKAWIDAERDFVATMLNCSEIDLRPRLHEVQSETLAKTSESGQTTRTGPEQHVLPFASHYKRTDYGSVYQNAQR